MASEETRTGGGVAMADGPKPALAEGDTRTLAQRLAAIRAEAYGVGKSDIEMKSQDGSKKWNIKGHTVEGVLSEMRPLLVKHGVGLTPSLVERTYSGNRCDVMVDFIFEALDDEADTRTVRWAGAGTDNGDKAFAKAGTNALKEMLKKLFLITDRDDAKEEAETVEHQTEDGVRKAELERVREQARANLQQWAATFKAALETATTKKDVERLALENRDQLASEDLPAVTRTFFVELIETKKKELA